MTKKQYREIFSIDRPKIRLNRLVAETIKETGKEYLLKLLEEKEFHKIYDILFDRLEKQTEKILEVNSKKRKEMINYFCKILPEMARSDEGRKSLLKEFESDKYEKSDLNIEMLIANVEIITPAIKESYEAFSEEFEQIERTINLLRSLPKQIKIRVISKLLEIDPYTEIRVFLRKVLMKKAREVSITTRNLNSHYLDDYTRVLLSNKDIYMYLLYRVLSPIDKGELIVKAMLERFVKRIKEMELETEHFAEEEIIEVSA